MLTPDEGKEYPYRIACCLVFSANLTKYWKNRWPVWFLLKFPEISLSFLFRMEYLPIEIEERVPSDESMQHVVNFAKLTGDIRSLSVTDLSSMEF